MSKSVCSQTVHRSRSLCTSIRAALLVAVQIGLLVLADKSLAAQATDNIGPPRDGVAVLQVRCANCHNAKKLRGGLDLTTREGAIAGGDSGSALTPGNPGASSILLRAIDGSMPPVNDAPPLPRAEVEILRKWISAGAEWSTPATKSPNSHLPSKPTYCLENHEIHDHEIIDAASTIGPDVESPTQRRTGRSLFRIRFDRRLPFHGFRK